MAEITRVPLQPIQKGSLTKIWLGVIALLLAAAGIAYAAIPHGLQVTVVKAGTGESPTETDVVVVNYVGKLADGTVFDQGQGVPLPLENMIPGFKEGLLTMQKGGSYELFIPAEKGYGPEEKSNPQTGEVVIPANSDLVFEIDLLEFMTVEDFQRQMQMQQMMMEQLQQQQGQPGAEAPAG